ncbi:MAG: hypothetical protein J3T61_09645 [Candidatus Brocadiales bacterium]|nr:hypothetical protein [Candidatus Bathyanammoxibius sp.]
MAEQLSVGDWPKKIANEYRKGPVLPYDLEQWIILAIRDVEKQAQAEVLAACINEFDQYLCSCSTNFVGKPKSDHEKSCPKYVVGVLRKLQPAASHLEELLREEREKWLKVTPRIARDEDGSVWMHVPRPIIKKVLLAWADELEKARAEGKG